MERFLPPALSWRGDARIWGLLQGGFVLPLLVGGAVAALLPVSAGFTTGYLYMNPGLVPVRPWIRRSVPIVVLGGMLMSSASSANTCTTK